MTAKGKINASNVQTGDRIIVKIHRNDAGLMTHVTESRTKTGEDVMVARVTDKAFRAAQGRYEARGKYVITTTVGTFEAAPIQTMWLAPEDTAGIERARKEAILEDAERTERAARDAERLEAPAQPEAHSVAANSEAYWTKGCGADVLAKTKELCEQDEIRALRAEFPDATDERKAEIQVELAIRGTVVYPEGTPEYAEYQARLRKALADWRDGDRTMRVADVEVVEDPATGQPAQVAVTRMPESGYPSTSYEPLPQREPGKALADAQVAELVEDLADMARVEATSAEAREHAERHARAARPGHTAQVQLQPLRDTELVELASAELCLAIGSEWGRLEGHWLRVVAFNGDQVAGVPLRVLEAGEHVRELDWQAPATRSRRTGYVLMVGKTLTVNSRPYEIRHTMAWDAPRLYPI